MARRPALPMALPLRVSPLFPGDDTMALASDAVARVQAVRSATAEGDTSLMAGLRGAIAMLRDWNAGRSRPRVARPMRNAGSPALAMQHEPWGQR